MHVADLALRTLARQAAAGDAASQEQLKASRCRAGFHNGQFVLEVPEGKQRVGLVRCADCEAEIGKGRIKWAPGETPRQESGWRPALARAVQAARSRIRQSDWVCGQCGSTTPDFLPYQSTPHCEHCFSMRQQQAAAQQQLAFERVAAARTRAAQARLSCASQGSP